jgi:hypothetical protein
MSLSLRNLDWLRSVKIDGEPAFGQRLYEMFNDVRGGVNTLAQQTNSNLNGNPTAPPAPDAFKVVPHPQGVEFAITHNSDFYQGIKYEVDAMANGQTHSYDVGSSRNGFLPVGPLTATYRVRALYPNGQSSNPIAHPGPVTGASVKQVAMLPGQGSGTTRQGQPPGFGGAFRSSSGKPPVRST